MATGSTYSFLDVHCAITGPGGSIILSDNAVSDEGVRIRMADDKTSMTTGAGRGGMHSLHGSNAGTVTVTLLKTSPVNAALMAMYNFQRTSAAYAGRNTISLSNPIWGDDHACSQCAFVKAPDNVNGKTGGMMEWSFNSIDIDSQLGDGTLPVT